MENENENLHSFHTHSLSVKTERKMDADIVEIPPPIHLCKKQEKRAFLHDVIDIDDHDDNSKDFVIIGERVGKSNKGKTIEAIYQVVNPVQEVSDYSVCHPGVENFGPVNGIESSNGYPLVSHKLINVDGHGSDDYIDIFSEHYTDVDEYALLQKAVGSIGSYHANFKDEILRNFRSFEQFDTVIDASDHYFIGENFPVKQHSKNWAKEIEKEWKILEKDLPDSIFVRVYESRMDLLRAVIIGAEGTPYHDGLFFFDLCFPSGYPIVPPLVYFHSRGVLMNPNLFDSGTICLSLLGTASGSGNELWLPRVSTILQVLVSIQGLILNENPFFNGTRSGWERTPFNESMSQMNNEETFIKSLWLMEQMIRRPPKNFEDFVAEHFISRAHDILVACNAYMEGAQVGRLVKGEVQDVDEGDKSCSEQCKDFPTGYMKVLVTMYEQFKNFLAGHIEVLVKEFARIGAKDCEKFLYGATRKANKRTFSLKSQFWDLAPQK